MQVLSDGQSSSASSSACAGEPKARNGNRLQRRGHALPGEGTSGKSKSKLPYKGKTGDALWEVDESSGVALDVWHYSRFLAYTALGFMAMSGSHVVFDWVGIRRLPE